MNDFRSIYGFFSIRCNDKSWLNHTNSDLYQPERLSTVHQQKNYQSHWIYPISLLNNGLRNFRLRSAEKHVMDPISDVKIFDETMNLAMKHPKRENSDNVRTSLVGHYRNSLVHDENFRHPVICVGEPWNCVGKHWNSMCEKYKNLNSDYSCAKSIKTSTIFILLWRACRDLAIFSFLLCYFNRTTNLISLLKACHLSFFAISTNFCYCILHTLMRSSIFHSVR